MDGAVAYAPAGGRSEGWGFDRVDGVPYVDEHGREIDHRNTERWEQLIGWDYVEGGDRVLELGGRYGTVSCLVNNRLADPHGHAVIEPDARVIDALIANRDRHNAFFTVYQNVVGKEDMALFGSGYSTCCRGAGAGGDGMVKGLALDALVEVHGGFNVLIADCEGCLEAFVRDNMAFLAGLRMVTYEADCPDVCDYEWIEGELVAMGFLLVKTGAHKVWVKKPREPNMFSKDSIFKKFCGRTF